MFQRPVFDPALSLGWRTGPLDGLSCLLRCVEATLRAQGFDQLAVARALASPLDVLGGRRPAAWFRGGRLHWRNATDGTAHWPQLRELVDAGVPVTLMPDRYYWPGSEFEGRLHFLDHMVLVLSVDDAEMLVLDTDAPAEAAYERRIPVTPDLARGACRFATTHFAPPRDTAETLAVTLLTPTARWLADDVPALRTFADRWRRAGLTGPMARALHVIVLGEVQPQLFLTAVAVADTHPTISAAAAAAAKAAQALGLLLIGTHRYAGVDPEQTALYRVTLPRFIDLADALTSYVDALHTELGLEPPPPTDGPDDRLWDRVDRMREWCFADGVAAPDGTADAAGRVADG